jgi:hypothetical protein
MKRILLVAFITTTTLFSEVVFEAKGWGKSQVDARDSAIASLSSIIISKVESSFEKTEITTEKSVKKRVNYKLAVTSKMILKGVEYIDYGKEKGSYVAKATLSRQALKETVSYLYKLTKSVDPRSLSREDLKKQLEYLSYLRPLVEHVKSSKKTQIITYIENREIEFLKHLNQAQVQFHIVPEDATISIGNNKYENFESIFLDGAKYRYVIKRNGFYPEEGKLNISNGEKVIKTVSLVKETSGTRSLSFTTDDTDFNDYFAEALSMYNISISNTKKHKLTITTSRDFVMDLDGIKFYNYVVEAKLFKNGKFVKSNRAKMKNKTASVIKTKKSQIAKALVRALFSKKDMENFF